MGYGRAQFVRSEWGGLEAQQRYEDVVLIGEALRAWRPSRAVEFGTAGGGFATFLGLTLREWGAPVWTFDKKISAGVNLPGNVWAIQLDLLRGGRW